MGNLMLAADALGLGSCWIHRAKQEFELPEYQQLLADLGIEGEYEGIGHCILGYPDMEKPEAPLRKDGRVYYID
jgi:nitroreductase